MAAEWNYKKGDRHYGPIDAAQLKALADSGDLTVDDLVMREGDGRWIEASMIKGLFTSSPQPSPPPPPPTAAFPPRRPPAAFPPRHPPRVFDSSRLITEKRVLHSVSVWCTILGFIFLPLAILIMPVAIMRGLNVPEDEAFCFQLFSVGLSLGGAGVGLLAWGVGLRLICGMVDLGLHCATLLEDIRHQR